MSEGDAMTATTLYEASIPVIRRSLANLSALLDKGAEHFAAAGVAEDEWLGYRLADDMHPLLRQVQIASDGAKGAAARLSGQTPPSFPDEETSVAELRDRSPGARRCRSSSRSATSPSISPAPTMSATSPCPTCCST
jgi:hypothetical protein